MKKTGFLMFTYNLFLIKSEVSVTDTIDVLSELISNESLSFNSNLCMYIRNSI